MASAIAQTAFFWAGRLMMAMAVVNIASCLVAMVYTQALMIDLTAFIVYFLGQAVAGGGRRAAKWSLGLMVLYLLMAVMILIGIAVAPDRGRIGGRPVTAEMLPWTQGAMILLATWSAVCAGLLIRGLRETRCDSARPISSVGA